ncbi:MAG: hypothetical protein QNK23_02355 [Crocinitomicaceae bacterium]|nr:hypothetical protein [Crocinitomicaceae bacterium]
MKNRIFILLFTLLCHTTFGGQLYSVTVHVTSNYNSQSVENVQVIVRLNNRKKHTHVGYTDKNGDVHFDSLRKRYLSIVVRSQDGMFMYTDTLFCHNRHRRDLNFNKELYPSVKREREIRKLEDSIYGTNDAPVDDYNRFSGYNYGNQDNADVYYDPNDFQRFLGENFQYPERCYNDDIQGTTYVWFVVEKDGWPSHIELYDEVAPEISAEIRRVIRAMPNWKAAEMYGQKVRMLCTLPFKVELR